VDTVSSRTNDAFQDLARRYTAAEFLIAGVIDSSVATAVRVTSPDGASVVVSTGPPNQATDGRFFLARLDLNAGNGTRLDRFTIEDASP
jgi:hypothetical protein